MNISEVDYSFSLTVYDLPNVVIPFFGGIVIDKLGAGINVNLSNFVILLGNIVIFYGAYYRRYWTWIYGYIIVGVGGEIQLIAGYVLTTGWFYDQISLACAMM